jgi:hypothetical protein
MEASYHHIGRDHPAPEKHGKYKEGHDDLPGLKGLYRERIGSRYGYYQIEQSTGQCIKDSISVSVPYPVVLEHLFKPVKIYGFGV